MRSQHSEEYRTFLARLIAARQAAGLTQMAVAERLGIPRSRLSRMESGERRIDIVELAEFARLYRKPFTYFVKL